MEQTPFDYATSNQSTRSSKRKIHPLVLICVPILLVGTLAAGYKWWQVEEENRRRDAVMSRIKEVVLADNALVLEVLEMDESTKITYAEFFKRTEKNKEERDTLIRKLRSIETEPFTSESENFTKLMELENEFVRAEEDVTRQNMKMTSMTDALKDATESQTKAGAELSQARKEYMEAPYGDDYSEKLSVDWAEAKNRQAALQTTETYEELKSAQSDLQEKMSAASLSVKDWQRQEPLLYSPLFPRRDVSSYLVKRKTKYDLGSGEDSSSDDTKVRSEKQKLKAIKVSSTASNVPSRLRSTSAFDGERHPQTRMKEMDEEEIAQLSDEDLQYAINEMFARYGMTFKDKTYQANFEGTKWYQPNDRWTANDIEKVFTSTEHANFKLLTSERNARRDYGAGEDG